MQVLFNYENGRKVKSREDKSSSMRVKLSVYEGSSRPNRLHIEIS